MSDMHFVDHIGLMKDVEEDLPEDPDDREVVVLEKKMKLAGLMEDLARWVKRGEDIHEKTAVKVLGAQEGNVTPAQRRTAKAINFVTVYGGKS